MNSDDFYNQQNNGEDAVKNIANKGKDKLKNKIKNKANKFIKKAVKNTAKLFIKVVKYLISLLAPYLLVILCIALVAGIGWYFLFEVRGAEQSYTLSSRYVNDNKRTDGSKNYKQTENYSRENREINAFYKYFSTRSYYKMLEKDKKLISYDIDDSENEIVGDEKKFKKIKDYYNKEEQFYLSDNLLFSIDERMSTKDAKSRIRYPEQLIQPICVDKDKLEVNTLTDKKGNVIVKSKKYDKDGKRTSEKVNGIWDYGIASILHYHKDKRVLTVEGVYTKKDVWDAKTKSIKTVDINEPFEETMEGYPQEIYLIDKALSFGGDFTFKYTTTKERTQDLVDGASSNKKDPNIKIAYGTADGHTLYKYRTGGVYETIPKENGVDAKKAGDKYLRDYLYNYKIYVPKSVMNGFNFEQRTGKELEEVETENATNIDYNGSVAVGGDATDSNDSFANSKRFMPLIEKWCTHFGIKDPYLPLAMIAQESSGNPNLNKDGLMQVAHAPGEKMCGISSSGSKDCIVLTAQNKLDPDTNVKAGIIEFQNRLQDFGGDALKAIQSYNFGPGLSYIKKIHPESWNSSEWMKYREEAREHNGYMELHKKTCSADANIKGCAIYGDTHYVEHVLKYYAGKGDFKNIVSEVGSGVTSGSGTIGDFIGDLWSKFTKEFLNKFHEAYKKDEERKEFKNYARPDEVDSILRMTLTFKDKILFSETNSSTSANFWDESFAKLWMSNSYLSNNADPNSNVPPEMQGFAPPLSISNPTITSGFGNRNSPTAGASSFHKGVDIAVPEGTPVLSVNDGSVIVADKEGTTDGCGKHIRIKHGNGAESLYCHLSDVLVKKGDKVKKSQKIGLSGNSGVSKGPHLHFGFFVNGQAVDGTPIVKNQTSFVSGSVKGKRGDVIKEAMSLLGIPYVWGGDDSNFRTSHGYDCSGFTQHVFKKIGINLDRTADAQKNQSLGKPVNLTNAQPGDLLFFTKPGAREAHHVAIFAGGGKLIHAPHTGDVIKVAPLYHINEITVKSYF